MSVKSYDLPQATVQICGSDENGQPDPRRVEWVRRGLCSGRLTGYKVARQWRMTDEHIAEAIKALEPSRPQIPEVSDFVAGLTDRSRKKWSA